MTRPGWTGLLALLAALGLVPQAAAQAIPADQRERFALALDAAVARVSQAVALPVLGAPLQTRSFPVPGVGCVFVLPSQTLPSQRRVLVLRRRGAAPSAPGAETAMGEVEASGDSRPGPAPAAPSTAPREASEPQRRQLDRELLEVEELALAYQREVERMSRQAEEAMLQLTRALREGRQEVRIPVGPVVVERVPEVDSAPEPPEAPEAPPPAAAPLPPWRYWFEAEQAGEPKAAASAARLVAEVRSAIAEVIDSEAAQLRALRADEVIVVAVDFVPRAALAGLRDVPRPRSLVLKVRKRDVDARRLGRLTAAELRERIETVEY